MTNEDRLAQADELRRAVIGDEYVQQSPEQKDPIDSHREGPAAAPTGGQDWGGGTSDLIDFIAKCEWSLARPGRASSCWVMNCS